MLKKTLVTILAAISGVALVGLAGTPPPGTCLTPGQWFKPNGGETIPIAPAALIAQLASKRIVLLGEHHDDPDHHRWQLQVISALHAQHPNLVIGMEMLPRRVQPALDDWVAGKLTETELLQRSDWARVWGIDPSLYLPIFHFARLNRIPVIGVNVDRNAIRAIGEKGLAALSSDEREGIGTPASATPAYRAELERAFKEHGMGAGGDIEGSRFLEAQLFRDRAFAEGLLAATKRNGQPLVVGIMGSGHLRGGDGVPHQLADLALADVAVLLPVDAEISCADLPPGIANAVFAIAPSAPLKTAAPPKLGVRLESDADGVHVAEVAAGSVADRAGLKAGDVVREVASRPVKASADVTSAVARQAPGTWLPLQVARNGSQIDLVAKFPPEP